MKLLSEFSIKGSPSTRTAQQRGCKVINGHILFYEKPEVRKDNEALFWQLYPHAPEKPFYGKLCIRLMWVFDKKSLTKAEKETFHDKRPDLDNLAKGTLDIMQKAGIIAEDSIICKLDLTKAWSKKYAGLYIQIWHMDDENDINTYFYGWRQRVT
jgi:Holliday junction resolvase RusA-like endonuclease